MVVLFGVSSFVCLFLFVWFVVISVHGGLGAQINLTLLGFLCVCVCVRLFMSKRSMMCVCLLNIPCFDLFALLRFVNCVIVPRDRCEPQS